MQLIKHATTTNH